MNIIKPAKLREHITASGKSDNISEQARNAVKRIKAVPEIGLDEVILLVGRVWTRAEKEFGNDLASAIEALDDCLQALIAIKQDAPASESEEEEVVA